MTKKKPIVVVVTGFKGGIKKTTVTHHLAERLDELGRKVFVFGLDDQLDIARRLIGELDDVEDGCSWDWGQSGEVTFSSPEELSNWDLHDIDVVLIDTPKASRLPDIEIDRVLLLYMDYESVHNNAVLIDECTRRRIPYRRIASGTNEAILALARKQRDDVIPESEVMQLTPKLSIPVWQAVSSSSIATKMKDLCDGWIRWIEDAAAKRSEDQGEDVPKRKQRRRAASAR